MCQGISHRDSMNETIRESPLPGGAPVGVFETRRAPAAAMRAAPAARVLLITEHLPHDVPTLAGLLGRGEFKFVLCPPADVPEKAGESFAAAVLVAPPDVLHGNSLALVRVLDALVENHLPAVVVTYTEGDRRVAEELCAADGIMAVTTACPAAELAGRLAGLIAARPVVMALQAENAALRQCDHGLTARLSQFDEELRLAARLQSDFLPRTLSTVGPAAFDVFFRPAGYVSGDIYDVFRLDEQHVGFLVADAVGHGMPAALLTIFVKRTLTTKEILPGGYRLIPPDEALARLNNDLVGQELSHSQFVTMVYAILNTRTLELEWARAGHPLPMLLRADGTTAELEGDGALLGIFPNEAFPARRVQLHPGDAVLLYTDGFESAFVEPGDAAGAGQHSAPASERYREEFAKLAGADPRGGFARMAAELDAQQGSLHQPDDLTALLVTVGQSR
jgi:sigma-B regulation protein RsbU (phosphoserine phosphatase)